ncbi:MAG: glycosyltransferase [bacterium]|nr:glycosyltransferase [bacterium]
MLRILKHAMHLVRKLRNGLKAKVYGIADFNDADLEYKKSVLETSLTPNRIAAMRMELETFSIKPRISVVMPVYNIRRKWLVWAVQSVLDQVYENWELCIADDASPKPHIRKVLKHFEEQDKRIKVKYLESNQGMSGSSNAALSLATGDYVALMDHDDELSKDSLFEVVKLLNNHPEAELIYSDEDKMTVSGQRFRPVRKPGWNPDLFLTHNYLCHLIVCKRELMVKAGGFRKGFEGSQDYDLLLQVTEMTDRIFHIPKVLYHWRMVPGSAAAVVNAKSQSFDRAKQALKDAMERRGIRATICDGEKMGTFCVKET